MTEQLRRQRDGVVPEISVVCPMFNEGAKIAQNVGLLRQAMDEIGRPWEVILVNDGSLDDSEEQAKQAVGGDDRFRVVGYRTNRGRGFALRTGFAAARGRYIVVTESDLTWGRDIIRRMLEPLWKEPQLDMVVASPHMKGGRLENVPAWRVFLTQFGNKILRFLMPGHLTMNTGMTRAYRRAVVESLDLECDGKEIHLEIIAKATSLGYRMTEVPAVLRWEPGRKKRKSTFKARKYITTHLAVGAAEFPFVLFGTVAGLMLLMGVGLGIYLFTLSYSGQPVRDRPLLLFAVLLIVSGFQVMFSCFVANQARDLRRQIYRVQADIRRLATELANERNELDQSVRMGEPPGPSVAGR